MRPGAFGLVLLSLVFVSGSAVGYPILITELLPSGRSAPALVVASSSSDTGEGSVTRVASPTQMPAPTATASPLPTATPTATATAQPSPTLFPIPSIDVKRKIDPVAQRVPIMMYHYIRVNPDPADRIGFNLSVQPADFAAQMDYLAERGYRAIGIEELVSYLAGERDNPPPPRSVVLTFDDGYRDFYESAFPVLARHGFQATVFTVSGLIGRPGYLTWPQLRELAASGITIGGHTVNHPDLSRIPLSSAAREIGDCKETIERELGQPVHYFAYPSGRYNEEVSGMVKAAGYRAAVTVAYGLSHRPADLYTLQRVRVSGGQSLASFASTAGLSGDVPLARPTSTPTAR